MPFYYSLGNLPPKRHTVFRNTQGGLYYEELVSTEGFSSLYSLVYHVYPPTRIRKIGTAVDIAPKVAVVNNTIHRSFRGFDILPVSDYVESRKVILCNQDVQLSLAAPQQSTTDYFFKNAMADELIFVHQGSGVVKTAFGSLPFKYGDYIHIPRGVVYQIFFDTPQNRLLIIESFSPIYFPKKYLNRFGQFEEHSPIYERDIQKPQDLETHSEEGEFEIRVKKEHQIIPVIYANHPFDLVGWDGYFYPYIFSIHNFEPITGRLHQPPPVHQTYEARNFVVCSFCPRLYDYHPLAIPAPYAHSNIDSDEVLYYVDGDFMSRNNIQKGQITLHPIGLAHGPHPGAIERSIGAKETKELAVMVDTFRPLHLTQEAVSIEDPTYLYSWLN
ncbi:MAG: homogentisate 1,2-dioxygenase [Bacteroidia bacterium]|nr:homogentisate 1,2-dioxygenase [Bacteroidia bacterium]MDW8157597.1 homogentisate 1,2-dioxygenase [Bacteroidia bacterium]